MSDEDKHEEEPKVVTPSAEEKKSQEKHEKKEKKEGAKKETDRAIDIRDYSKVILFYPLFFYSIIAFIIMHFSPKDPITLMVNPLTDGVVGILWVIIFAFNLFVVAFNFPTAKFFILFLILIVAILIIAMLYVTGIINLAGATNWLSDLLQVSMNSKFYAIMTGCLGVILVFVIISARFSVIHIEQNEVFIRKMMTGQEKRYPTSSMRYFKEIDDVFEYIAIGAGRMTFTFGPDVAYTFNTIPMINKIAEKIDILGDSLHMSLSRIAKK
jgi:hypothetical protein